MTTTTITTTEPRKRRKGRGAAERAKVKHEERLRAKLGETYVPSEEYSAARAAEKAGPPRYHQDCAALAPLHAGARSKALEVACERHAVPAEEPCYIIPRATGRGAATGVCEVRLIRAGVHLKWDLLPPILAGDREGDTKGTEETEKAPRPTSRPRERRPADGLRGSHPRRRLGRSELQEREHRRTRNKAA